MTMVSEIGRLGEALLGLARQVVAIPSRELGGLDCVRLARKVSLLCHLFEEIGEFAQKGDCPSSSSASPAVRLAEPSPSSRLRDLLLALEAVRRFLLLGRGFDSEQRSKTILVQFQYVTWQLEKALKNIPYNYFEISDEVCEQVDLVRSQLGRSIKKNEPPNLKLFSEIHERLADMDATKPIDTPKIDNTETALNSLNISGGSETEKRDCTDSIEELVSLIAEVNGIHGSDAEKLQSSLLQQLNRSKLTDASDNHKDDMNSFDSPEGNIKDIKKPDPLQIPEDYRCPISLELMRDPVIVSTGQTYERSSIQRWIDGGNQTCPKTQQKLHNFTLTPNYVLRSLIMQWCESNNFEQTARSANGWIRKSDGTYVDVSGDRALIDELIHKLSSGSVAEKRSSAAEIRSMAKKSTDNRILIAEAGAIPVLIKLLTVEDQKTQEHAVTAILNLSIYDTNKSIIMLAGAIPPIIQVLRSGSMEARENSAAAIFSLSLVDENKIIIGSTPGAIDELVELLGSESVRGRKDAATALFNLCIYQGNKVRAIRAGILAPLLTMLTRSPSTCMVDEALTILSVLVSHHEGRAAITKANMIPVLVDLLRDAQPRNKENAAAILLALCKKDHDNLAVIGRLGASIPLSELARNGTERAKRKASSLLDHMNRLQRL